MKWYIGQQIISIRNHSQNVFKKGDEFKIIGLRSSTCNCDKIEIDIGIRDDNTNNITQCSNCNLEIEELNNTWWFSEVNFSPLDQDISELTEILEKPLIKSL